MAVRGGYAAKILRVDLTRGTITKEALPSEEVLRRYVGGTGMAVSTSRPRSSTRC